MHLYVLSFLISIIFWLWIIRKYDKFEREPIKNILFVFIVGGLMSVVPAGIFNIVFGEIIHYDMGLEDAESYTLWQKILFYGFVGINEEFWKATATVLLIRRMRQFNEPADALVYSMSVAFGFSVFENIDYSDQYGLSVFFVRQVNAVPLHVGLASIWGIGIARTKFIYRGKYRTTLIGYVLLAAFLHAVYNLSIVQFTDPLLNLTIPTAIGLLLIWLAIKRIKAFSEESPFSNRLICHHCHTPNLPDTRWCRSCGKEIQMEFYDICKICNTRNPKNSIYCSYCGSKMN